MNVIQTTHLKSAGSCAIVLRTLFDSCFNIIGKLILIIFCYTYKLWLSVGSCFSRYLKVWGSLRTSAKTEIVYDETLIKNEVLLFEKIPRHLTLVVGAESPSYKDLINIIKWSIPAGISHVSFYDHHNGIDSEELFNCVCKHAKQYIPLIKWGKSFSEEVKQISRKQINGFSWRPVVTIHIYTKEDWPAEVLDAVGEIRNSSGSSSVSELDSILRRNFLAPDPDLAFVFGSTLSFFGFPPWHLRITQILNIPSHHNITLENFINGLREYSCCQQRYGK